MTMPLSNCSTVQGGGGGGGKTYHFSTFQLSSGGWALSLFDVSQSFMFAVAYFRRACTTFTQPMGPVRAFRPPAFEDFERLGLDGLNSYTTHGAMRHRSL